MCVCTQVPQNDNNEDPAFYATMALLGIDTTQHNDDIFALPPLVTKAPVPPTCTSRLNDALDEDSFAPNISIRKGRKAGDKKKTKKQKNKKVVKSARGKATFFRKKKKHPASTALVADEDLFAEDTVSTPDKHLRQIYIHPFTHAFQQDLDT